MSSRSDKWFADRYEADKKWYEDYCQFYLDMDDDGPTEKQKACIYAIRKHNPNAPEFKGYSKREASNYISVWGG